MRKLKLQVQTSVAGFIAGPDGEMDWMTWDWDDELKDFVWNLTEPVETILLGRKLADGFVDTWTKLANDPETTERFARKMVETRKIVFSRSLEKFDGANTEVERGELVEEVGKLKNAEGGDVIVYGGAEFIGALVRNNLIDEYNLFVNPAALGNGLTIFGGLRDKLKLGLTAARTFSCGIVVLRYESASG